LITATVDVYFAGIGLRFAGCAATVGDVFFQQRGQAAHDFEIFGFNIFLFADVGRKIVKLNG
jgi:hypothetical protein